MSLLDMNLDKITEAELNNLISNGVPESLTIDYKRETYRKSDDDKSNNCRFLTDVSSFANTIGGDILIGINEANGLPTSFNPFIGDIDAEVLSLQSIALSGIEPRITNLTIRAVPVAGGHIIIVRVPRSFAPLTASSQKTITDFTLGPGQEITNQTLTSYAISLPIHLTYWSAFDHS